MSGTETEQAEIEQRLETERRLTVAAAVLARGVRRVLGDDLATAPGAVEQENDALPVLATEAVMAAPLNQENARR
ncbi:MAG: hypothetical protein ACTHU0_17230 [Kofleriaceae bacterium]